MQNDLQALPIGQAEITRKGSGVVLLAFGAVLIEAMKAAEQINATVVNMRFVKPLDEQIVAEMAQQHDLIITLEDNAIQGGAGSAVAECLAGKNLQTPIHHTGLPDEFMEHASREALLSTADLDSNGILRAVNELRPQTDSPAWQAHIK